MNDIYRPKQTNSGVPAQQRPVAAVAKAPKRATKTVRLRISFAPIVRFWRWLESDESQARVVAGMLALLMIFTLAIEVKTPIASAERYSIAKYEGNLLTKRVPMYSDKLTVNQKTGAIEYNKDFQPAQEVTGQIAGPKFAATFSQDKDKPVTITDSVNKVNLTLKQKFPLEDARNDGNKVVYPLKNLDAKVVYTTKGGSVKEDIILDRYQQDELTFNYEIALSAGTEVRAESDGSLAVYGVNSKLLGNVTAGTEKDQQLLDNARKNGEKNVLLFRIPAPFIVQADKRTSPAKAWFSLEGTDKVTLHANGLKGASYPLSIDPSVYIETAAQLMKGNNETNVDFDVTNELIQKSQTTGARIDGWANSTQMNSGVWDQSMAAAGGYVYRAGGRIDPTMPYIVGQQSSVQATNSTTFVMNMPTTRPAGDLYVAIMAKDGNNRVTPPAGWTEYGDDQQHAAYYKVGTNVSGGNEAASYTWTVATTAEQWAGVILRIKGFDSATPISGTAGTGSSASAAIPVFPTTTPASDATLIIRSVGVNAAQPAEFGWLPTGHTKVYSATSSTDTANSAAVLVATMDQPPLATVATGTTTLANDGLVNDTYGAATIAIKPATVSAGYQTSVQWARFNTSSSAIDSPNPGNGTCSGWCSDAAYALPAARVGMQLIAYNGYLYAMGGSSNGTDYQSTVYIAKLGANGEPQLWHPTGGSPVYWYPDTGLSGGTGKNYMAAYAYNNRMYILGGKTSGSTGGVTTVEKADIQPNGVLSSWTTTGMQALPSARFGHSVQVYNDVMYLIGGNSSGTLQNTVYYSRLNNDGTMNPWVQTNSFTTARASMGGNITGLWGAYIYIAGGCSALTSGFCSTVASDVQLASINADGSIAEWNGILNLSNQRIGYSFIAWQNGLYRFGGCNRQNTSTGVCYAVHQSSDFGVINQDGDASTVSNSQPSGTAPCNGTAPTNCDLPPAGDNAGQGGQMSSMVVINNGYIYNIGGCTDISSAPNECSTGTGMSGNVSYATLNSTGALSAPGTCGGTSYGLWCVDSTNRINGTAGVGAAAATVFNNTVYVIGGTNGTGTWTSNVYSVGLNNDGSLSGAWTTTNAATSGLPANFPTVNGAGTATTIGTAGIGYGYAFTRANPASAGTTPGNLYYLGGCNGTGGVGCSNYSNGVYKCNLNTTGAISGCTVTGQMQIDADNINTGNQGLGLMAGAVYANRIYLVGGACTQPTGSNATDPCGSTYSGNRQDIIYAKIDNSNNIVDKTTGLSTGSWAFTTGKMSPVRRRAVSFGYNGYIYSLAGYSGTASLQDLLFAKLDVSTGDMGNFSSSGVVVTPRWDLRAIVSNGYVYAIGGCGTGSAPAGCTAMQPQIQTFQLYNNDSGAAASYTASAGNFATNTDRWGASSTILNGYIYVAGGCTSATDCTTAVSDVQYAALSATDGTIGAWSTATNGLPAVRTWGQLVTAGGYLYYLGGQDSTATNEQSTVYYVGTFSSGNITAAWSTASGGIGDTAGQAAQARTKFGAASWNNRIYVVGGLDGSAAVTNTVYISPQLNSGGDMAVDSWTASTTFNVARSGLAVTAYANNLYLFGGVDTSGNYLNDSQFSQIAANGTVGAWSYSTPLPGRISQANAFAANGYMYLVGGRSAATSCSPSSIVAPISANTTIASGNNPTGIGDWYETNIKYAGGRYGTAVAYSQGKVYVMGGGCTSPIGPNYTTGTIQQTTNTVTGSGGTNWTDNFIGGTITYADASTATILNVNSASSLTVSVSKTVAAGGTYTITVPRHSYGIFKSQPQVAKYSRMIDADTDVFPTKWLLNGLDNSIGARWQMRYRSSTASAAAWGQETNFGDVTLGTTGAFTPKDSGGTNTNFARYYYFSVSIDSSQTFGYPEDVNRGPTITDLSLFFTADPSKRLIHGKTFIGGEQQPLDTPCNVANPNCQ